MRSLSVDEVRFDAAGLAPVIVQHASTGKVLMLAWTNQSTLAESITLGKLVFFSRSRNSRWLKGETSGNFLEIQELSLDCDGDAILAQVIPVGPACHNGTETCFEEPDA